MRADRLLAILLLMQRRGRVTAADLAAELEVSVATARRDLEALAAAGVPVYPQPGRGGGWSLVGGARTDLTGLTAGEARALFLLTGPSASVTSAARSALRKITQALPGPYRADAEAAATATVVDPAAWDEQATERPTLVDTLQHAVVQRRVVRFAYRSRAGEPTSRSVAPWGVIDKNGVWYLIGGTNRGSRTFRLDRMADVDVTSEPADRPEDFDLATAWRDVVTEVERRRSEVEAILLIEPRHVDVLRGQFGRHVEVQQREPDGRARVRVAGPSPSSIAEHLAGWGAGVEVLEPDSVRAELARIGSELVGRYRS